MARSRRCRSNRHHRTMEPQRRARVSGDLLPVAAVVTILATTICTLQVEAMTFCQYLENSGLPDLENKCAQDKPADEDGPPLRPDKVPRSGNFSLEYGATGERDAECNTSLASCRSKAICGRAPANPLTRSAIPRIHIGSNELYGEFPSYVRLLLEDSWLGEFECGAVLITDQHILTVAQCVTDDKGIKLTEFKVKAVLGEHYLGHEFQDPGEKRRHIDLEDICVSANYKGKTAERNRKQDDWAVLKLGKPIRLNRYIQPACVPWRYSVKYTPDSECYAVGSGMINTNSDGEIERSDYVQKLRVQGVPCKNGSVGHYECFIGNERPRGDTCEDERGAPIICLDLGHRWSVVALKSWGPPCIKGKEPKPGETYYLSLDHIYEKIFSQCEF